MDVRTILPPAFFAWCEAQQLTLTCQNETEIRFAGQGRYWQISYSSHDSTFALELFSSDKYEKVPLGETLDHAIVYLKPDFSEDAFVQGLAELFERETRVW